MRIILNEDKRRDAWGEGQIPKSTDSFVHSLVHIVDRERLRFEFGNSSTGSRLKKAQDVGQHQNLVQHMSEPLVGAIPTQAFSLDTGLNIISRFEPRGLGLGPPSPGSTTSDLGLLSRLHCNEWLEGTCGASWKRFGSELGRLGKNIHQKLLCGFLHKEGKNENPLATSLFYTLPCVSYYDGVVLENPNGCWEANPKQLP